MESIHRLEGTSGGVGGLVVRKKKNLDGHGDSPSKAQSVFKGPTNSILGLDILAAAKKKLQVDILIFICNTKQTISFSFSV